MVWCGSCYLNGTSDIFQINEPINEDGNLIYDCESNSSGYKFGMYGACLMVPLQCGLCFFLTLYHMNPRQVQADE